MLSRELPRCSLYIWSRLQGLTNRQVLNEVKLASLVHTDEITTQTLQVYYTSASIWPSWGVLKMVEIIYLPSIVSGWAVKICGFTANRVPSTTSVTFSGVTVCELMLEDKAVHPWRSWLLKYSVCLLLPSWKWQLCVSSEADNILLIWGLTGQAVCRHSESKPDRDKYCRGKI